jgi:hypothetical protein
MTALRFGTETGCCPSRDNIGIASAAKVLSHLVTPEPDKCLLLAGDVWEGAHWFAGGCFREIGRRSDEVEDLREAGGSLRRPSQGQSD